MVITTLYVAVRLDHLLVSSAKDKNLGVEVLAYTDDMHEGTKFLETVIAKYVYGRDWVYERDGDPFFDPYNSEQAPPPVGKFAVWDDDSLADDPLLDRPTSVVASAAVFSEAPARAVICSFKLCRVNPMISDFVRTFTEGDREMQRQMASCGPRDLVDGTCAPTK